MSASSNFRLPADAPVMAALAFLVPILAPIAPLSIWIPAVAATLIIALRRAVSGGLWPAGLPAFMAILFGVVVWSAISALWAIDALRGFGTAGRLLLVAGVLMVLAVTAGQLGASERETVRRWLIYGAVIGIVITLAAIAIIGGYTVWVQQQKMTQLQLAPLNRSASIIALLIWPVALSITQTYGRGFAVLFIVMAVAAMFLLAPATPLLATIIGASAFVVAWFARSLAKFMLIAAFALCIVIVPFLDTFVPLAIELLVANLDEPVSEVHRLVIWQFAAGQILDRPLFGWGLEAARLFPGSETELFLFTYPDGTAATGDALPLHTHNTLIQIWLELGLVGVALFATLFVLTVRAIPFVPGERARTAVAVATIASGFVMAQLSYGIWQGWWLATLGIAAVVTAVVVGRPPEFGTPGRAEYRT